MNKHTKSHNKKTNFFHPLLPVNQPTHLIIQETTVIFKIEEGRLQCYLMKCSLNAVVTVCRCEVGGLIREARLKPRSELVQQS